MDIALLQVAKALLGTAQAILGITQLILAAVEGVLGAAEGNLGVIWTAACTMWIGVHAATEGLGLMEAGLEADADVHWWDIVNLIAHVWAQLAGILQQVHHIQAQLGRTQV